LKRLSALFLTVVSGAAIAQTTGTVNPSSAPSDPSVKEDVPPGGCMPIGLTASGEIVFPIQCKEFIERERGKTVGQKPPVGKDETGAKQAGAASENSNAAVKPMEPTTSPERIEPAQRARPDDSHCSQHYRSYDRTSGTYMGYDGQRHSCR
jgi:hypothetical protein